MSKAALTDSTAQAVSPARTARPALGRSTKTTSVISCWAWSEMPTVPSAAIHSWVLAKRKSSGFMGFSSRSGGHRRLLIKGHRRRLRRDGLVVDADGQGAGGVLGEDLVVD